MKNNKGFTLIELLAVVMILGILLSFAAVSYSSYLSRGKQKAYEIAINSFEDAAVSALEDCEAGSKNNLCDSISIPEPGNSITISLDNLVTYHYIDKVISPYDNKTVCTGTTTLKREEISIRHNDIDLGTDNSNISYTFNTCITCKNKEKCKELDPNQQPGEELKYIIKDYNN